MITRIVVPFLDANSVDVTVTAWCKAPGDRVQTGEIVAELTTDKATFELGATGSGTLLKILAAPKSVVPSGYILALLGKPGDVDVEAAVYNDRLMEKHRETAGVQQAQVGALPRSAIRVENAVAAGGDCGPPATPAARVRATPRARRLAQEQKIDLVRVQAETGAEVVDDAVLQKYLGRLKAID